MEMSGNVYSLSVLHLVLYKGTLRECVGEKENKNHYHLTLFQFESKTASVILCCLPRSNLLGNLRKE